MADETRSPGLPATRSNPGPGVNPKQWALLFEHAPVALILVDEERRVLTLNRDAALLAGPMPREMLGQVAGMALGCANADDHPGGCGHGQACDSCGFRRIIADTFTTGTRKEQVEISACFGQAAGDAARRLLVSTSRVEFGGQQRTLLAIQRIVDQALLEAPPPRQLG